MKQVYLAVLSLLLLLSACDKAPSNDPAKDTPAAVVEADGKAAAGALPSPKEAIPKAPLEFLAKDKDQLSSWDFETAYQMCTSALTDYYHAVWTGSDFNGDAYFVNEHLKQYMQAKISDEYGWLGKQVSVTNINFGAEKIELVNKGEGYFYLKLSAHVEKYIGGFAEPTEFIVQNVNGRLVIADWYTNRKDSYDFTARDGVRAINNPDIWNDEEWVKKLKVKTQ